MRYYFGSASNDIYAQISQPLTEIIRLNMRLNCDKLLGNKMTTQPYPKFYLYRRIVQAKLYIDRCYYEKIDLDNISNEASFSKFHFIRLFKSIYGKTPHQYLTTIRIDKAQQHLQLNKSVKDVCFLVGFDSVSTFSGLFTKVVGQTPSDYTHQFNKRKIKLQTSPFAFVPTCFSFMHGWTENSNFQDEIK